MKTMSNMSSRCIQGLCFSLLFAALAWLWVGCGEVKSTLTPSEVRSLVTADSSVLVLDVRNEEEYRSDTGHLAGARLIPVQELEHRVSELEPYKGRHVVVYCRTGRRSARAQEILTKQGFHVSNMEGGIVQWNKERLPVVYETP